jgi:hypothetical protein
VRKQFLQLRLREVSALNKMLLITYLFALTASLAKRFIRTNTWIERFRMVTNAEILR